MKNLILPLANWGIGTIIIGVFAIVCIVMTVVVFNLVNSGKKRKTPQNDD